MYRACVVVVMAAAACDSSGGAAPIEAVPTSLQVVLSAPSVEVGQTVTATATALDQNGAPIALPKIDWTTSRSPVATVDAQGTVTAVAPGNVSVIATSGALAAMAALTVTPGPLTACRLPGPTLGVGLGFPRVAGRLRSTGDVHIAVLFVDFSDAIATRTPDAVFSILSPEAEQFYEAVSYEHMHLVLDPHLVWLRMSKPTSGYPWNPLTFATQKAVLQEALDLAGPTLDVSATDAILVITNPDSIAFPNGPAFTANPGDGVVAGGKRFDNAATSGADLLHWGARWLSHEFGHTMSLVDLYDYGVPSNPEIFHFVGEFSMMGNISGAGPEYLAWERWVLGWLDDNDVVCAPRGHTTATLTPVEVAGGTKLVVVPTGATTAVAVESRHALGYDSELPSSGVLVYFIDTSIASGRGTVKILPIADGDLSKLSAPLGVAQSLTYAGVTVTFTAQDASGDQIDVTY
jgi:M6 family metalloprotease-like protein